MEHAAPAYRHLDAFRPLTTAFGERLGFTREGARAEWSFDGHRAIVQVRASGRVTARFVAPPARDAVSGGAAAAVYARDERGYPLTAAGCERMVADMIAFFSGSREPEFTLLTLR